MTPAQLRRREALIARSDAALERWPERAQSEFTSEMGAVAQALESLALKGPGAMPGSFGARLLAAMQELKSFVGALGMAPSSTTSVRDAAMELFVRLGRLTTWISEAGDDMARLHPARKRSGSRAGA